MGHLRSTVLLLVCTAGIYTAYLTQGVLSEELATKKYGSEEQRFPSLEGLNGLQSVACFMWGFVLLQALCLIGFIDPKNNLQWHDYKYAGITNTIGPGFGMFALKNITYSAQVLAKSCKMVPVMILGTIIDKKRYSALEYACMMLIAAGISVFSSISSHAATKKLANPNAPMGYLFCILNLAFDGYTNAAQDKLNSYKPKNSPVHMMCWMNFWTAVYSAIYLFVITNSGQSLVSFLLKHHDAAYDVFWFCMCGAIGQLFIFFTIKTFGSLVNTLLCTTRKFFNILLSVMFLGNPLLPMQWGGVGMVFAGLLLSMTVKRKHKKKAD